MRPYRRRLRHTLPVLAVIALGNPVSALPRGGQTDAVPGARPAPFPVQGTQTVELRYPTFRLDGGTEVSIVNTSEDKTVVAWKLDYDRDGYRSPSFIRDGYPALLGRQPMWSMASEGALIEPGDELRIDVPFSVKADVADGHSIGLVLDLVIFDDLSYEGDPDEAKRIFEKRAESLAERERWLPRVRELARTASSAKPAIVELRSLVDEMEAAGDPRLVRELQDEVRNVIRHLEAEPHLALPLLEEYLRYVEAKAGVARESTPPRYRRKPIGDDGLERRIGASWECSPISTSRTVQMSPCGPGKSQWSHDENWNFVCSDPGHQGTGLVHAFGECAWGEECPPILSGPDQWPSDSGSSMIWNRSWQNRRVLVGMGWARCDSAGPGSLVFECPCDWVDEPPPTESGPEGEDAPAPGDGTCTYGCTPILVDLDRAGFRFTDLDGGVLFDIDADQALERVSWTAQGSGDAFLVLDRDGNGAIDGGHELFGDATDQPPSDAPHGYLALAVFDRPAEGGNGDGLITAADAVFASLRLWVDADHDGASQPGELSGLAAAGVESIDLDFRENRRKDRHGNELRYRSLVRLVRGTTQSVDVFFLTEQP